ncbi:MAG: ABC transporter permease subunit [Bosea sp.]|jgi:putrescine transport system permease protein|nr:ABC transporter permease subunit [Bosea sp. (in: a-proteobacteria)]
MSRGRAACAGLARWRRALVPALPMLWLCALFLLPFAIIARIALSTATKAQPPYLPVFDIGAGWARFREDLAALELANFRLIAEDSLYLLSLLSSLRLAAIATLILLLICYPLAIALARLPARLRPLALMLVILPFWTSFLIRIYAWVGILRHDGYLNALLQGLGLTTAPVGFLDTDGAIILGIVYAYLPFMALPVFAAVDRLDPALHEAAQDLGCPPWRQFWAVTLPLTLPGAMAGCLLVFIPAVGEVIIPDLLGGSGTLTIGRTLWAEFFANGDWPLASALTILLLLALLPPLLAWRALEARQWRGRS